MTDTQNKMLARIWIDTNYIDSKSTVSVLPCNLGTSDGARALPTDTAFVRADIVEHMAEALEKIVADRDETEMQFCGQPTQIRNSSIEDARILVATYRKEISHDE